MPLHDTNMLPKFVRNMDAMSDLLEAEQQLLDEIEKVLQELLKEIALIDNRTINRDKLKELLFLFTERDGVITEDSEQLTIKIRVFIDNLVPDISYQKKLEKYIPAHLRVLYEHWASCQMKAKMMMGITTVKYIHLKYGPIMQMGEISKGTSMNIRATSLKCVMVLFVPEGRG